MGMKAKAEAEMWEVDRIKPKPPNRTNQVITNRSRALKHKKKTTGIEPQVAYER